MSKIKSRAVNESEWVTHEVDDQPMTIICHQGDVRIAPVDQIEINPEITVYHGKRVVIIDTVAKAWAEHILGYELENVAPDDRASSEAHIIGLCDLPIKLMQKCKKALPFFIKEPETYLHPSQQVKIADWMIAMTSNISEDGIFVKLPPEKENTNG